MKRSLFTFTMLVINLHLTAQYQAGFFKDPRDGQEYPIIEIGNLTWFAANLNYETEYSYCYENQERNCKTHGRLYKWEVALEACPQGWHLSTDFEWQELELEMGMEFRELAYRSNRGTDEGKKLKEGGESGFNTKYAGWRRKDGTYSSLGKNAAFWTSTDADLAHAWHRDIDTGDEFVFRSRVYKPYALSVRCVKNHLVADEPEEN